MAEFHICDSCIEKLSVLGFHLEELSISAILPNPCFFCACPTGNRQVGYGKQRVRELTNGQEPSTTDQ